MKQIITLLLLTLSLNSYCQIASKPAQVKPRISAYTVIPQSFQRKDPLIEFHSNTYKLGFFFLSGTFIAGATYVIVNFIKASHK